jgi:hypothetical protein
LGDHLDVPIETSSEVRIHLSHLYGEIVQHVQSPGTNHPGERFFASIAFAVGVFREECHRRIPTDKFIVQPR